MSEEFKVFVDLFRHGEEFTNKELLQMMYNRIGIGKTKFYEKLPEWRTRANLIRSKKRKYLAPFWPKKIAEFYDDLYLKLPKMEEKIADLPNQPQKFESAYFLIIGFLKLHNKLTWILTVKDPSLNFHERRRIREILQQLENLIKYTLDMVSIKLDFIENTKLKDGDPVKMTQIKDLHILEKLIDKVSKKLDKE